MAKKRGSDLFKVDHLSKLYGDRYIFNDVNFTVKSGEILGVIARSGSGKTTFLNMLVGLIQPEKGGVYFKDSHLVQSGDHQGMRRVQRYNKSLKRIYGFAAQNPSFYPSLTAWENLMYFGSLYNIPKENLKSQAENLLKLVDLSQAKNMLAKNMSGGMKRRLDIACSLVHDPKILILDEPTADLDPVLSNKIWNILRVVNQKGTTVILASHHIIELEHLCDRIIIFKDGRIAALGKPSELKSKNLVEESIYVMTSPGDYDTVIKKLSANVMKNIEKHKVVDKMLVVDARNTNLVIKELIKTLEANGEKIIDIEFRKPTLDKVFIQIDEGKVAPKKTKKKATRKKSAKKRTAKKKVVKKTETENEEESNEEENEEEQ